MFESVRKLCPLVSLFADQDFPGCGRRGKARGGICDIAQDGNVRDAIDGADRTDEGRTIVNTHADLDPRSAARMMPGGAQEVAGGIDRHAHIVRTSKEGQVHADHLIA